MDNHNRRPNHPTLSVIIGMYNAAPYIGAAIESLLAQSVVPDEVLVVDDGSTDESASVVQRYGSPVRLIHQANAGLSAAHNLGVREAQGEMLAFLDADDLWAVDKTKRQLALLSEQPDVDVVFGHVVQFPSPELTRMEVARVIIPPEPMPGYVQGTMLIRRSAFLRTGFFDPSMRFGGMVDWFARAQDVPLKMVMLDETLLYRRIHLNNMTRTLAQGYSTYARVLKSALDRRRGRTAVDSSSVPSV